MLIWLQLCAGAVVAYVTYFFFKTYQIKSQLRWVGHHAPSLPVLGSLLEFTDTTAIIPVLLKYSEKFDGLFTMDFGHRPYIIVSDSKFLEFILTSQKVLDKGEEYRFLDKWLGTGLLTAGAEKWHKTRKIITPAFHFSILEKFVEVFDSTGDVLIKKLEGEVHQDSFDIFSYIKLFALDTICESSLGVSINAQDNKNEDYVFAVLEMCRIIVERSFSAVKYFDPIYALTQDYKKEKRYIKVLHSYTDSIIKKRKQELSQKKDNKLSEQDDVGSKRRTTAFLDLLLQTQIDGHPLSDDEIRQEVDTFMFAGHDTVTAGTSYTLYELANNPQIQEEVFQEQKLIMESSSSDSIGFQDLKEMKYLEKVIKESLRMYPPVPMYVRNVKEEAFYNGNLIPKGTSIMIFAYGVGRNGKVFPEPDKFDPSRFDGENKVPYSYIPFSAGPRNCIGQKYAMLEMKSILGKILRNYELLPATPKHELKLASETVLKSLNGIKIQIRRRLIK